MQPDDEYVLTLSCPDRPGIVHAVASCLVDADCNILDSQQYGDPLGGRFFMRVHLQPMSPGTDIDQLRDRFAPVAERLSMTWRLVDGRAPVRTLVLVSKSAHCLNDLLFRQSTGSLPIDVRAVVGNHRDLERLSASYDVAFHHLPVTADTKAAAEGQLMQLVGELDVDLVVLARYMQVLSDGLCQRLSGRAINIHHSFLPSFKGAKPYHQAHERGVKLIGATAHYVTAALDEGPIIEQDVTRVGHGLTPSQLVRAGQDVEAQVLSRAVRWHAESRVLLNGTRTVVFA
jgi:formyltetrahydrofolate deformylase